MISVTNPMMSMTSQFLLDDSFVSDAAWLQSHKQQPLYGESSHNVKIIKTESISNGIISEVSCVLLFQSSERGILQSETPPSLSHALICERKKWLSAAVGFYIQTQSTKQWHGLHWDGGHTWKEKEEQQQKNKEKWQIIVRSFGK